jgi:adenosylcobyric acid synthase
MLGNHIHDPEHLESGDMPGLGLLDLETTLKPEKVTTQRTVKLIDDAVYEVSGYEIHHGLTEAGPGVRPHLEDGLGWQQGNVWGIYLHGIMENSAYRQRFLSRLGWQGESRHWHSVVDDQLNSIANVISDSGWFA